MSKFRSVYDPGDALIAGDVTALETKFPITAPDIATDAVTAVKIQADAVTTAKIANDAVTQPKAATGVVDGDTITGAVVVTAAGTGERILIRNDGSGGIIEFFSGVAGELAGSVNPAVVGGTPSIEIKPSLGASFPRRPTLGMLAAAGASADGTGGAAYLTADQFNITMAAGGGGFNVTGAASTFSGVLAAQDVNVTRDIVIDRYGIGAGMDSFQAACSSTAAATSTTNVTIAGWSIPVTSPGTSAVYLVTLDPDWTITVAGTIALIELLVDGTPQTAQMRLNSNAAGGTGVWACSKTWRITGLAAGTRTFTARTRNTAGSTGSTVGITHSLMTVERKG